RGQSKEAVSRFEDEESLLDHDATESGIAQVLTPSAAVVESTPAGLRPLLTGSALARATQRRERLTNRVRGLDGQWRLLAVPVGGTLLVGGRSRAGRHESLDRLEHEFLLAAPLALILATLAGYALAGAALRPVEAMRRRATAITAAMPDARLPVPPG